MKLPAALLFCFAFLFCFAGAAWAAQFETFGDIEVHYVVVNSNFITAETADEMDLEQARDRAFVNISVLKATLPIRARVTGYYTNLFGQRVELDYREVTEPPAVYYLASFKHADQETLRFTVNVAIEGAPVRVIEFQETVYWEAP